MSDPITGFAVAIGTLIGAIVTSIDTLNKKEHAKQEAFTQMMVEELRLRYPAYNVLIVHPKHSRNLVNEHHHHEELKLTSPRTKGYEVYIFESGTFNLEGDGGLINWCFGGRYERDGSSRVNFSKIPGK